MARYRFIFAEKANFSISLMSCVLRVSRSGYYAWRSERAHAPNARHDAFDSKVKAAHKASKGRYGSRRLQRELRESGIECSRTRVSSALRRLGLSARGRRRFKATTDSKHAFPIAPNILARNFTAELPNQAWVGDITYVPTREGWLYLAVLIDLYSRKVVGWAMSSRIDRKLVLTALSMAKGQRRPRPGLVHHTDRGSQYASEDYQDTLKNDGFQCSMSRKGDCWDNAVAESFFGTIKAEELRHYDFQNRQQARAIILEYLRWYNAFRRHSTIGLISPNSFEKLYMQPAVAA